MPLDSFIIIEKESYLSRLVVTVLHLSLQKERHFVNVVLSIA